MPDHGEPYRGDLCRSVPFQLRADGDGAGDGLSIFGVATPFDSPTLIDSWEGTFYEHFVYSAFRKSLSERIPRMQFDHGHHPLIGSIPIGRWTSMKETQGVGVEAEGRLHDNWLIEPVRQAVNEESIDGMSIRFSVVREEWRDKDGKILRDPKEIADLLWNPGDRGPLQRAIKEAKMSEAGPVVWPAYEATTVGVRSVTIDLGRLRDRNDRGERAKLARAVFLADAAERTETVDAPPSTGGQPSEPPATPDAPQPSADQPDEHPAPAAPPADRPQPGTHPSPASEPANPAERAAQIRARFRVVTDRYLALSKSLPSKENTA